MALRTPGTSIPASEHYPGLLAHDLGNGREIVVCGWARMRSGCFARRWRSGVKLTAKQAFDDLMRRYPRTMRKLADVERLEADHRNLERDWRGIRAWLSKEGY